VRVAHCSPGWRSQLPPVQVVVPAPARPHLSPATDALAALDTGDSQIASVIQKLRRVQGKPIAILLAGESGVGKERFARAIHASGPRGDAPYVALNCAALPENLIEAELFGYAPGAFTGAHKEGSPGRLREADGGTLFLDEIGDMPLALQARLLRVLQEREVTPLGGGATVKVDFALICASHRNLRQEVEAGRFRSDLYYRINGLPLTLPALRERSDLATTVQRLLHAAAPDRPLRLTPDVLSAFLAYRWPGNLRQLASALQTAVALLDEDEHVIAWPHLPDDLRDEIEADTRLSERRHALRDAADEDTLKSLAFSVIEKTLTACRGNISAAARRLGISRNTLYRRLEEARRQGDEQP
jgi:transcriptional regulator with PAS, ATPase and Fis domain